MTVPSIRVTLPGYTATELEDAQAHFGLRFPPELYDHYRAQRVRGGHDWVTDWEGISRRLEWPLEGLLFDVEECGLWWPEWGERPDAPKDRADIIGAIVAAAPKLIPLYSHRYIPEEPNEAGNPVFSVMQSDIICIGANLTDYLRREFSDDFAMPDYQGIRRIRFWSDCADRAWNSDYYPFKDAGAR